MGLLSPALPVWIISRILHQVSLDQNGAYAELAACAEAGGVLTALSREHNCLFHSLSIRTTPELLKAQDQIVAGSGHPVNLFVHSLAIDGPSLTDMPFQAAAGFVLFSCVNAKIVDLQYIRLSLEHACSLNRVRKLVLQGTTLEPSTTITDFLSFFTRLEELTISDITYGDLDNSARPLPASLLSFYIRMDDSEEDLTVIDHFLRWMAMHPQVIPNIEEIGFLDVNDNVVEDVVLVLSYLKPTLTSVVIGIREGNETADDVLAPYCTSNMFPIRSYQDYLGQTIVPE